MQDRSNDFIDLEALSQYNKLKNEISNHSRDFNYVMDHMPPTYTDNDAYVKNYVKNLSIEDLKARADALIKTQNLQENHELLDYMSSKGQGNFHHFRSQWSPILWQSHEKENTSKIKIGEKIINSHDLDYSIAETLEAQDSSQDPIAEYHNWIQTQATIENDIYSAGTTLSEIERRNMFIDFMDLRETEIKRIATLYSAAALNPNSPMQTLAQEKLKFTLFKLSELRRLRDRMKSTKSHPDNFHTLPEHVQQKERINHKIAATIVLNAGYQKENDETFIDSIGEHRINNKIGNNGLTYGMSDNLLHIKPVTKNIDEANSKINNVLSNHHNMVDMLNAMRNGMSKDEWLKRNGSNSAKETIKREVVRKLRGFDINSYNQALRELNM